MKGFERLIIIKVEIRRFVAQLSKTVPERQELDSKYLRDYMSAEKIIAEIKKGVYKPVYWLEGDEDFFIDKVLWIHLLSSQILTDSLN